MAKPSESLRVKKKYINKKKWINWRISLHYEYFVEKKMIV